MHGVHGDTSTTFLVGDVDEPSFRLVKETARSLDLGIAQSILAVRSTRSGRRSRTMPVSIGWCRA